MKKIILYLGLAMLLCFALAGCSDNSGQGGGNPGAGNVVESQNNNAANSVEVDEEEAGKTLVAYYSGTGYTKAVAEVIAAETGGDLFELAPVEAYTDADLNWRDENSRVNKEHDDPALRVVELVSVTPEDWAAYDTVYIGYPIWWGIAAWPVNGFVQTNDFDGKTVIPFCTSSSSGLGDSGQLLADMANGGDWQTGQRFPSNVAADDVIEWVQGLSY